MSEKRDAPERLSLARWSRRKLEGGREAAPVAPSAAPAAPATASAPAPAAPELPSIESLGFDSDFTAFLRPGVDDKLKRAALKQLFRDPRFNVMDGLDVYIDDYTKADPIAPEVVQDLLRRGFSALASTPPAAEQTSGSSASAASATVPATGAPPAAASTQPPAPEAAPEEPADPRSS